MGESRISSTIQPGLVIAGRYRVDRQLGEGGMGSVFLVQHVHTDEQLALKVLNSTVVKDQIALERFRREARTPARIQSDHVVKVTDADVAPEIGGAPFLVMEYLRGEDLDQIITRRGPLPPGEVVMYLRQTARALDKAHQIGVIHRDLKPENLFVTRREDGSAHVKLLDFGIAKLTDAAGDMGRKGQATTTGQIFGTPMFMAPEQALAESHKISPQTDIWALGLIAHKLLTGNDIWTATTLTHLVAQIAYEPMPVPSSRGVQFGPAYDAWFARACARQPEQRHRNASEAVGELARALGVRELPSLHDSLTLDPAPPAIPSFGGTGAPLVADAGSGPLKQTGGPLTTSGPPPGVPRSGSIAAIAIAAGLLTLGALGLGGWFFLARSPVVASAPPPTAVAPAIDPPAATIAPAATVEPVATTEPAPSATASVRPTSHGRRPPPPPSTGAPIKRPPPGGDDPLAGRH